MKLPAPLTKLLRLQQFLALYQQAAKSDHERTVLRRQIESTDHEIDHLVYELYELTDEEIAIVEEASSNPKIVLPAPYRPI